MLIHITSGQDRFFQFLLYSFYISITKIVPQSHQLHLRHNNSISITRIVSQAHYWLCLNLNNCISIRTIVSQPQQLYLNSREEQCNPREQKRIALQSGRVWDNRIAVLRESERIVSQFKRAASQSERIHENWTITKKPPYNPRKSKRIKL